MDKKDFLSSIKSLLIDRHILGGKRGAEENIKIKIIVPLLQSLGWNLLDDIHFEYIRADIVLFSGEKTFYNRLNKILGRGNYRP